MQQCEVGVLYAYIADSGRIYEMLGDQRAQSVINQCFRIISEPISAHGGMVVKTFGDELMAAFARPVPAVSAAIDIQRRMEALPPLPFVDNPLKVAVRIGLHYGSALREHHDFFGDTVNIAEQIVACATARQILTTMELAEALPRLPNTHFVEAGAIEVRGRPAPVRMAAVSWGDEPRGATVFGVDRPVTGASTVRLVLRFGEREWRVDETTDLLSVGRDPGCDIQLAGLATSRNHATIERRSGKWFIMDHSTNGTGLVQDGKQAVRLHREESVLTANGRLYFGKINDPDTEVCDYSVKELFHGV